MRKVAVLSLLVLLVCLGSTLAFAQTPATMSTPTPGSTLSGSSVTFTWTTGTGVTEFPRWFVRHVLGHRFGTVMTIEATK